MSLIAVSLFKFQDDELNSVNLRDVWKFVESKSQFSHWVETRLQRGTEGVDFTIIVVNNYPNGRPSKDYIATVDFAKSICMMEDNAKGDELRRYFVECEKIALASKQNALPQTYIQALEALVASEKAKEQALLNAKQAKELVDFFENKEGLVGLQEAMRQVRIKPNKGIAWLKEQGYLTGKCQPTALLHAKKNGTDYFLIKSVTDQTGEVRQQTFVTVAGLTWLKGLPWPSELYAA